jgi:type IV pilus biogenesis protein CpaD/CtpE
MEYVLKAISAKRTWLILILALSIAGCAPTDSYSSKLHIMPLNNKNTITLAADDIVRMMRQVGFSDKQILDIGTDMRDSLLRSGAAQLKIDNKVEAIFAVNAGLVYIATRSRGTFVYNVKTGRTIASAQL